MDDLRAPLVESTAAARSEDAPCFELHRSGIGGVRLLVPRQDILGNAGKTDAADQAGCSGKGHLQQLVADAQCLKDLCAAIAIDGKLEPHFAHNLEQALVSGLDKLANRLRHIHALKVATLRHQLGNRGIGQVGINCIGAKANQGGNVMYFAVFFTPRADLAGCHA